MSLKSLEIDQAKANYDEESQIIHIAYSGVLSGDVTVAVYSWLDELLHEIGTENVYGEIFDFRKVIEFAPDNLSTARRTSSKMNMKMDTSQIPVALLISDAAHQEIFHSSMRISPQNMRRKIVWSKDEALEFFDEWHQQQS
jgi:hypothetical protein